MNDEWLTTNVDKLWKRKKERKINNAKKENKEINQINVDKQWK